MRLLTLPAAYRPDLPIKALFGERFYWPFAKDMKDVVTGASASIRGNARLGTDGSKKSIVFPGGGKNAAGAVDLPEFQLAQSWTVSLWVKVNNLNDFAHLFDAIGAGENYDPVGGINLKIAGDNAAAEYRRKFYFYSQAPEGVFYGNTNVAVGEWMMITVTYRPGLLSFYLNDKANGTRGITFSYSKPFVYRMGGDMGNTQNTNGFQRDVRVWDSALPLSTIQQLYARG